MPHHHPGVWSPGRCRGTLLRLGWDQQPPFDLELSDSAHSKVAGQKWPASLQLVAKGLGKCSLWPCVPLNSKKSDRKVYS